MLTDEHFHTLMSLFLERITRESGKDVIAAVVVWSDSKVSWNWDKSFTRDAALAAVIEQAQRLRASHPTEKEKGGEA